MSPTVRDRWLFEILRGADLLGSTGPSKYYRPKGQIKISTHKGQLTIRTGDQFDISNPECIRVVRDGFGIRIPWVIISSIKVLDSEANHGVEPDGFEMEASNRREPNPRRRKSPPKPAERENGPLRLIRGLGRLIASH